jgi:hypothetical protein
MFSVARFESANVPISYGAGLLSLVRCTPIPCQSAWPGCAFEGALSLKISLFVRLSGSGTSDGRIPGVLRRE